MPADWELPPGVTRNLWDYFHDPAIARGYDGQLAGTPLIRYDLDFVRSRCSPPGRIIDLGAGTGRLAIPLAREGYSVLAVDLSPEMLSVLKTKSQAAGAVVETLQANLVELEAVPSGSFQYAACLFGTLGMIVGTEERRRFLAHVHRILQPGGRFVLHVHNRWFNAWTAHGRGLLCKDLWNGWLGRSQPGDYLMPAHQGVGGLTMHLFTRREIVGLLHQAGFQNVEATPISLREDGQLPCRWWFGWLRSFGYLIAAQS